ncbi:MAG: 50S ribosomal protein L32 [Candidatus Pacebacteria bacterium]|nr:50S ribosomal protein L32 [Candidatus Paceibacterota bacterium]
MGKPRRHHTKSRTNMRRSHQALDPIGLVTCPQCKSKVMPHRVCSSCGFYKGEEIINVLKDVKKDVKKKK